MVCRLFGSAKKLLVWCSLVTLLLVLSAALKLHRNHLFSSVNAPLTTVINTHLLAEETGTLLGEETAGRKGDIVAVSHYNKLRDWRWGKKLRKTGYWNSDKDEGGSLGYVIAYSFGQQLESGMYDLHQLADLAHSWDMKLGEPYVSGSKFAFPATPYHQWKLSDLFDLQHMNDNLRKRVFSSYNVVINLQEIVDDRKIGADVVVIHLTSYGQNRCSTNTFSATDNILHDYLRWKQSEMNITSFSICLNKNYKINFRNLLKDQPILKRLQLKNQKSGSKIVVIFAKWNGIRSTRGKFFFWDPNFVSRNYGSAHSIRHSKVVIRAAIDLKHTLGLKSPFLGVHVRLERLIRKPLNYKSMTKCIDSLEATVQSLQEQHLINNSVMFRDYGAMGSGTCLTVHCNLTAKNLHLDQRMKALGVNVNEFNPVGIKLRPGLPTLERGFVSNVEQELLSQADYLIMVGYGSFQLGIVERFSTHASKKKVGVSKLYPAGTMNADMQRVTRICTE